MTRLSSLIPLSRLHGGGLEVAEVDHKKQSRIHRHMSRMMKPQMPLELNGSLELYLVAWLEDNCRLCVSQANMASTYLTCTRTACSTDVVSLLLHSATRLKGHTWLPKYKSQQSSERDLELRVARLLVAFKVAVKVWGRKSRRVNFLSCAAPHHLQNTSPSNLPSHSLRTHFVYLSERTHPLEQ